MILCSGYLVSSGVYEERKYKSTSKNVLKIVKNSVRMPKNVLKTS
jgi:hypothetical protein